MAMDYLQAAYGEVRNIPAEQSEAEIVSSMYPSSTCEDLKDIRKECYFWCRCWWI